jgi:hypothetical protein
LKCVAGLDVAFSTGGDQVVLRLAVLGLEIGGQIVLDFGGDTLIYKIKLMANTDKSAELQIAEQVLAVLATYRCPVSSLAIDVTGQGRAIGEVIRLKSGLAESPIKIYSTKIGSGTFKTKEFDVDVLSSLQMWTALRDFIQTDQIRGLDDVTIAQLTTRRIEIMEKSGKRALESKSKYKMTMGSINPSLAYSPDEADAAALCLQAAILRYGFVPGQRRDIVRQESFDMAKWEAKLLHDEEVSRVDTSPPVATFAADLTAYGSDPGDDGSY